jgi:hypothetical protein
MTTNAEEQRERRRVVLDEARARDQLREQQRESSAYIDHYAQEAGGRWNAVAQATVIGQSPNPWPKMPEGNPWAGPDLVGLEPPLSYRIDDLNPSDPVEPSSFTQQETDPTLDDAPSPTSLSDVQRAGVGSLSRTDDPAGVPIPSPPDTFTTNVDVGSSPLRRRKL